MRLIEASKIILTPAEPEYADSSGLERLFGISRPSAMRLKEEGKLRAVYIRERDHVAGKWLWDLNSVRRLLNEKAK